MNKLNQAIDYIEQGEIEEGLKLLNACVQEGTDEEKYNIARYYHTLGFVEQALEVTEELRMRYEAESELTLFLAELYIDLDREDEAIEVLGKVTEDDDLYVQALLTLADLYQMQGLEEVAEQKLLMARRLMPDESVVAFGLGELYSGRGSYAEAVPYYREVLAEHDDMAGVNISLRLAECFSALGQWEEAVLYYESGLQEQRDIHSLFGYAFTLYQAALYERAIAAFLEVKQEDPEYASLYLYLAECYDKEGLFQESYDTLREGLKADEYSADLHVRVAEAAAKLGRMDEAQIELEQAIAIDPSHLRAVLQLIHLFKQQEKYAEIIEIAGDAVKYGEDDPQLIWETAYAKKQLELYSDALNHYRDAYTSFKDDSSFLEEYGYFLLEEGLRQEAKNVFQRLLQLDPTQVHIEELLYNLEDLQ